MDTAQFTLGALVFAPLLAGAVNVLLRPTVRPILGVVTAVAVLALTVPVISAVSAGNVVELALGGYATPVGIALRADGLSAAFLALTAVVGAVVSFYAALLPHSTGRQLVTRTAQESQSGRQEHPALWRDSHPGFWPLWSVCWAGLNAVLVAGDLFNTYVGLELTGLTAVGLVALGGPRAWQAALRYLYVAVIGSLLFLIGIALIVSVTGTLDIRQSAAHLQGIFTAGDGLGGSEAAILLALSLMTIGLAMKVALVPMHRWLIPAHAGAPGAVSPLMSALVIKAALYTMLRIWLYLIGPGSLPTALGWLMGALGVIALVAGSVLALQQSHLKPLIAYSTVAQGGYWFLIFPVLVNPEAGNLETQPGTTLAAGAVISGALAATVALALGHGLAKGALFLVAGFLKDVYGTDEIARLRGVGRDHPVLLMALGLSAVGLVGLPISLSFTGKWQLATMAVAAGQYWILIVLLVGTLLSGAYMVKVMAPLLMQPDSDDHECVVPVRGLHGYPATASYAPLLLGLLTVVTGFLGAWLYSLLRVGAQW